MEQPKVIREKNSLGEDIGIGMITFEYLIKLISSPTLENREGIT